jgi:hypothetical protein
VQTELRAQGGSPPFGPQGAMNPGGPQGLQRQQAGRFQRRPISISSTGQLTENVPINRSPLAQAVPGSHLASPALLARSPNFLPQGGPISPSYPQSNPPSQQMRPQPIRPQPQIQGNRPAFAQAQSNGSSSSMNSARDQSYYVPQFQSHYDQLGKPIFLCVDCEQSY